MASRVVTRAAVRCKPLPVRARGSGFGVAACPLRHWVTFLHDTLAVPQASRRWSTTCSKTS